MEFKWYTLVILIALAGVFFALTFGAKRAKWNTRMMANGAMCIAISFVLSMIKIFRMPQGGAITPAGMLPLILFCLAAGPWRGLAVCGGYGLLMLIQDSYIVHPAQVLTDYLLAFGMMSISCAVLLLPERLRGSRIGWTLALAVLLGYIGRLLMATISGVIFFAEYAGEQNVWAYSVLYNLSYLGPDCLACMLAALIPGMPRILKLLRGERA